MKKKKVQRNILHIFLFSIMLFIFLHLSPGTIISVEAAPLPLFHAVYFDSTSQLNYYFNDLGEKIPLCSVTDICRDLSIDDAFKHAHISFTQILTSSPNLTIGGIGYVHIEPSSAILDRVIQPPIESIYSMPVGISSNLRFTYVKTIFYQERVYVIFAFFDTTTNTESLFLAERVSGDGGKCLGRRTPNWKCTLFYQAQDVGLNNNNAIDVITYNGMFHVVHSAVNTAGYASDLTYIQVDKKGKMLTTEKVLSNELLIILNPVIDSFASSSSLGIGFGLSDGTLNFASKTGTATLCRGSTTWGCFTVLTRSPNAPFDLGQAFIYSDNLNLRWAPTVPRACTLTVCPVITTLNSLSELSIDKGPSARGKPLVIYGSTQFASGTFSTTVTSIQQVTPGTGNCGGNRWQCTTLFTTPNRLSAFDVAKTS